MGGTSSRYDSPLPRHLHHRRHVKRKKTTLYSFFSCGLVPSVQEQELEDDPVELLMNSSDDGILAKFRNPRKDFALFSNAGSECTSPVAHTIPLATNNVAASDIPQSRDGSGDATSSNKAGHLFNSSKLFHPHPIVSDNCNSESSSSSMNTEVNDVNTMSKDTCPSLSELGRSLSQDLGETSSDDSSNGIQGTAVMNFSSFASGSTTNVSGSPFSYSLRAGSGLILSERALVRRDENTVLGDMTGNISPVDVSATSAQMDNEIRSTRLLSDAFFRHSRGFHDSRNYLLSNDDSDIVGLHDRWHNDLDSDFLGEGDGGTLTSDGNGTHWSNSYRQHSRSEVLRGTGDAQDHNAPRNSTCPTGIHSGDPCSCESILRGESSGSRASMSRIVMLAESLFEVLDEIHRQQPVVSLPVVPVPAGESVVNSLPMKNYKRPEESVCSDDAAKCYICLDEYEDGDNVRVLPCQHEYHMSCIDKWLKEFHSVCPLCRTDVKEAKSSISTSGFSFR